MGSIFVESHLSWEVPMPFFGDAREVSGWKRIASDQPSWAWSDALAAAEPGTRYRITDIVFSLVRDRCRELEIGKGDEIRCLESQLSAVELQRRDGHRVLLERDLAWFVQVQPIERPKTRGGLPTR